MSIERTIRNGLFAATTVAVAGCSQVKVEVKWFDDASISYISTLTAASSSPEGIEIAKNAPLMTPGAIENAIIATAQAYENEGRQEAIEKGLALEAVNSAVRVNLSGSENTLEGSGNLMKIDGYWVVLTAGHVLDWFKINKMTDNIIGVDLSRDYAMFTENKGYFEFDKFGLASAFGSVDIGVVVIPDKYVDTKGSNIFDPEKALTPEQLYFGDILPEGPYSYVCYPWISNREPTVSTGSTIADYTKPEVGDTRFFINNALVSQGCSGGGVFAEVAGEIKYIGAATHNDPDKPLLADTARVTRIGALGRNGLDALIKRAIDNLQQK